MPINQQPKFVLTPNIGFGRVNSAQVPRDNSGGDNVTGGTTTLCFTAGPNGSRVDRITFTSAQATPAATSVGLVRVYIGDRYMTYNNIPNYRLYKEGWVNYNNVVTGSSTSIGFATEFDMGGGLYLTPYQVLGAAISVYNGPQDQYDVIVEGYDY